MTNPLKYIPSVAKNLKKLDPKSREFNKLIQDALTNVLYVQNVYIALLNPTVDLEDEANKLKDAIKVMQMFIKITFFTGIATLALWIFFWGKNKLYALYGLIAFIGAVIFMFIYMNIWHRSLVSITKLFIKSYNPPSERFNDEQLKKLVSIEASTIDYIAPSELDKQINCGCYNCKNIFTSDKLVQVNEDVDYHCPYCNKSTVISDRCGHEVTKELLDDMNEYWINN